ncbi:HNH endonuclease [Marinobacter sp. F4218]|uniref:HNH endonuclease n=1 Tax=Marinobacter sp. F4218 TaxID=2862868 RepID=UPI001C6286E0|nr:HNH endonuclease [Marinobacter sp. F4218]MBW7472315.1 HNH endonuclease [Marinobacter sp. F4218]
MPKTTGHGNPLWNRDETILALDLYNDCAGKVPDKSDPRVLKLSKLLSEAPFHSRTRRKPNFRNPDGVAFKLQNIRQVQTGKGLDSVSKVDVEVVKELGDDPKTVKSIANLIRESLNTIIPTIDVEIVDEDEEFSEGRLLTRNHKARERSKKIRKKLLDSRSKKGSMACDMCGMSASKFHPECAESVFEAHHVVPLAEAEKRTTRLSDMALLCANCHRLIHRGISRNRRWLTIQEAKKLLLN